MTIKKLFVLLLGSIVTYIFAKKYVTIKRTFSNDKYAEVNLFKIKDAAPQQIAASQPVKKVLFGFTLFPGLEKVLGDSENWITAQKSTGNKNFDATLKKTVFVDLAFIPLNFLATPTSSQFLSIHLSPSVIESTHVLTY